MIFMPPNCDLGVQGLKFIRALLTTAPVSSRYRIEFESLTNSPSPVEGDWNQLSLLFESGPVGEVTC